MTQPLPQDRLERARRLSQVHPPKIVAELLGVWPSTLLKARRRNWQQGRPGTPLRPMPSDFAIQTRHMPQAALAAHYRCSTRAIQRWRRGLRA